MDMAIHSSLDYTANSTQQHFFRLKENIFLLFLLFYKIIRLSKDPRFYYDFLEFHHGLHFP